MVSIRSYSCIHFYCSCKGQVILNQLNNNHPYTGNMLHFTPGESIKEYYNFWDENVIWFQSEAIRAYTFIVPVRVKSFYKGSIIITILYRSFLLINAIMG